MPPKRIVRTIEDAFKWPDHLLDVIKEENGQDALSLVADAASSTSISTPFQELEHLNTLTMPLARPLATIFNVKSGKSIFTQLSGKPPAGMNSNYYPLHLAASSLTCTSYFRKASKGASWQPLQT